MTDVMTADQMLVEMDRELCAFLSESAAFTFSKEDVHHCFAAQMNLFTQKAGHAAALAFLVGTCDAEQVRQILSELVISAFDRTLISAGDMIVWKPEGRA